MRWSWSIDGPGKSASSGGRRRSSSWSTAGVIAAAILTNTASMERAHAAAADDVPATVALQELALSLQIPPLTGLREGKASGQVRVRWDGQIEESRCSVQLRLLPAKKFGIEEPDEVTDIAIGHMRKTMDPGAELDVLSREFVEGAYGYATYASIVRAVRIEQTGTLKKPVAEHLQLGFVLPSFGCALEITCSPPPSAEATAALVEYLKNAVQYDGETRDVKWSKAEIKERWERYAPETAIRDARKPIRTKHYLIMTNSSGGKLFAKKMEANYKKIQKTYPFEEVAGRRLMPVYLFRSNHEYYGFCEKMAGWSKGKAAASKGHAWKDYYATWYESPNDPVHIHESTHQIFANRLRLGGGGSWFQEGVAEYIETQKNARNVVARLVTEDKTTGLRDFMQLRSLLYSSGSDQKTGNKAHNHYTQAALLIEFLHKSRFGRDKFQDFLHAVGNVSRGDLDAIDQALRSVYQVGIDELEVEFQRYCKKR